METSFYSINKINKIEIYINSCPSAAGTADKNRPKGYGQRSQMWSFNRLAHLRATSVLSDKLGHSGCCFRL